MHRLVFAGFLVAALTLAACGSGGTTGGSSGGSASNYPVPGGKR